MLCYELKANLDHLTLAGYEDGEYIFTGTPQQWSEADRQIIKYEEAQ